MMRVDENLFFREATLRLCSSLEIEAALKHCYEYIRPFIPVKRMGLHLVDLEENTMQFMAHSRRGPLENYEQIVHLSEKGRRERTAALKSGRTS